MLQNIVLQTSATRARQARKHMPVAGPCSWAAFAPAKLQFTGMLTARTAQVTNVWIGVYEPYTADFLTERGIPCFDARSMLQLRENSEHLPADVPSVATFCKPCVLLSA